MAWRVIVTDWCSQLALQHHCGCVQSQLKERSLTVAVLNATPKKPPNKIQKYAPSLLEKAFRDDSNNMQCHNCQPPDSSDVAVWPCAPVPVSLCQYCFNTIYKRKHLSLSPPPNKSLFTTLPATVLFLSSLINVDETNVIIKPVLAGHRTDKPSICFGHPSSMSALLVVTLCRHKTKGGPLPFKTVKTKGKTGLLFHAMLNKPQLSSRLLCYQIILKDCSFKIPFLLFKGRHKRCRNVLAVFWHNSRQQRSHVASLLLCEPSFLSRAQWGLNLTARQLKNSEITERRWLWHDNEFTWQEPSV